MLKNSSRKWKINSPRSDVIIIFNINNRWVSVLEAYFVPSERFSDCSGELNIDSRQTLLKLEDQVENGTDICGSVTVLL
jgi:hypothetical protein